VPIRFLYTSFCCFYANMVRLSFVAVAFCLASSSVALSPLAEGELALGVVEGFVSDSLDLTACISSIGVGVAGEVVTAEKEITAGFSHLNMSEIESGLLAVQQAMKKIPAAEASCKKVLHDVEAIVVQIKKLHGPEAMLDQIVHNLLTDGTKIFNEISKMANWMQLGGYMDAGQQLGMALRKTLVGETAPNPPNGSTPSPPRPKGSWKLVALGAAVGFVSDDWSFVGCGMGAKDVFSGLPQAGKDFIQGLKHLNMTEIAAGIKLIQAAIKAAPGAEATCKAMMHQVEATINVIKQYHGLEDAIDHIVHNVLSDAEMIFAELSQMEANGKDGDYMNAGVQMGMAFRRMLVGEPPKASAQLSDNLLVV